MQSKYPNRKAVEKIQQSNRILLVTHIKPDGDAVGSLLGLGLALQESGRQVQMVIEDGIPLSLRRLTGSDQIRKKAEGEFDLVIFVDCSDLGRVGKALDGKPAPDINIDHHITNEEFAELNLVDAHAVATAEIIYALLNDLELSLTPPVAAALLTGLITDTLGFRTSNVRPETFYLVARLMETSVDLPELYRRALVSRSFEAVKFWSFGLAKLEQADRLVWTSLTMNDRRAANYPGRDDADLINVLSSIDEMDVSMIFVEQPNGNIKVSWRAQPGFDVAVVAKEFGGGGHAAAAGAEIPGAMQEVQDKALERTRLALTGGRHV